MRKGEEKGRGDERKERRREGMKGQENIRKRGEKGREDERK